MLASPIVRRVPSRVPQIAEAERAVVWLFATKFLSGFNWQLAASHGHLSKCRCMIASVRCQPI